MEFAREYSFDNVVINPVDIIDTEDNIFLHRDHEASTYLENMRSILFNQANKYNISLEYGILPMAEHGKSPDALESKAPVEEKIAKYCNYTELCSIP